MAKKARLDKVNYLHTLNGISGWEFVSTFNEKAICHDGPTGIRIDMDNAWGETVPASSYPSASALACSFDPELVNQIGVRMGANFSNSRIDLCLGPAANIKRSALCGRNWEYFSEDPLLSGVLAASIINGLQSSGTAACLKHYLCNNQEWYRHVNESVVSTRALRTIYAKSFEVALSLSNPASVMTSYNRVNGEYVNGSKYLMGLLKKDFGFDSLVMSDWNAATNNDGSYFACGLNLEMPYRESALEDYKEGFGKTFSEEDLEARLQESNRFFSFIKRRKKMPVQDDYEADYKAIVKAYESCPVLVKNEGYFPLNKNDDVLVVGDLAVNAHFVGGGSGKSEPIINKTFLDVLKENGHGFTYINGYTPKEESGDLSSLKELAKKHKKVLYFMGFYPDSESEGFDRADLSLPKEQIDVLVALLNSNPNVGVIIEVGSPVDINLIKKYAKGIYIAYPGGEGMNEGLYNLIYGKVNPSGHLAETWPLTLEDNLIYSNWHEDPYHSYYDEDIYVGYRYYDTFNKEVAYPFGHGLSYSKFLYSDMNIMEYKGGVEVSLYIENTSEIDGTALALVFSHMEGSALYREDKSLCGFKKVFLMGGEKKKVTIRFPYSNLYVYPSKDEAPFIEEGNYVFMVGQSIVDLPLSKSLWLKGKKAKAMKAPEVLKRRHYDYEYKFTLDTPTAVFCYISDFFKKRKHLFNSEGDYQWFVHTEEPVRVCLTRPGFSKSELLEALEEANKAIGGKAFIPLVR